MDSFVFYMTSCPLNVTLIHRILPYSFPCVASEVIRPDIRSGNLFDNLGENPSHAFPHLCH